MDCHGVFNVFNVHSLTRVKKLHIILLSRKKNKIMPFAATWMELETLILSEVSQKEKDKYHMISPILESNIQHE